MGENLRGQEVLGLALCLKNLQRVKMQSPEKMLKLGKEGQGSY